MKLNTIITIILIILSIGEFNDSIASTDKSTSIGDRLRFYRWMEDYRDIPNKEHLQQWTDIKHIPLTKNNYRYLSFGGDYRYRFEHRSNQFFNLRGPYSTNSNLHRFHIHSDLQFENARLFIQLSQFKEEGRIGGALPLDESNIDFQQAFIDLRQDWGQVRIGRQEIILGSNKSTGIREGPNQRRSFDAIRFSHNLNNRAAIDVFYGKEVNPLNGSFEDSSSNGTRFFGVYSNKIASIGSHGFLDIFYLGYKRDNGRFNQGEGRELRHTLSSRFFQKSNALQMDYEAAFQFGDFNNGNIIAWSLATETSYNLTKSKWTPRLGLRVNITSGDNDITDNKLGTFNALFPNLTYASEAAIYAPGNGIELHPFIEFKPHTKLKIFAGIDFQWRQSIQDAYYSSPGTPLIHSDVSSEKYVGYLINLVASWELSPYITFKSAFVHNNAGSFIKSGGGENTNFFMFSMATRF